MDGIDGIAALQALVVAGGGALLAGDPASRWMALALAAACLGFLPLNLPRARIFLGDVGSGALGYALALVIVLAAVGGGARKAHRSEEHTSELQSLMRISYAVFCLKKKKKQMKITQHKTKNQLTN